MPQCPAGHDSGSADYCDLCGIRMDGLLVPAALAGDDVAGNPAPARPAPSCPRCGTPGPGRFCESCGYSAGASPDREPAGTPHAGAAPADGGKPPNLHSTCWTAVITASRSHYDAVIASAGPDASAIGFPDSYPERTVALTGAQMRIGRRSLSREVVPEIDLSEPPADPGISRLHAILIGQPDGTWAVIDPGSENGTTVNDAEIAPAKPVPLRHGDTIRIGAWTLITILASSDESRT